VKGFSSAAMSLLLSHTWPGNVRELENVVGHACMMAEGDILGIDDLPAASRNRVKFESGQNFPSPKAILIACIWNRRDPESNVPPFQRKRLWTGAFPW
jgi:DNA-binding NtrC family response regulator